ncbi:DHS-like NAD/FAD-binding domain-containing protein [Melanomma pulvis-pyrius CBS 109.77]|uniref:DHS-like NAD/FAD-binding domain-containing protein n=1 Tax=Melanomma pulvis-pyrius CBS 109.77 TaxID=1314802 RepID=A0A6A6X320_9PLEO|nr:DHS-like NAD/FAD-binding domain-containing protein [Melanomma pulvis-pyrius CBS 109.77]
MDEAGDESTWLCFADFLTASSRVLCVVGAGLSAPSGLATWRGTNGLWNDISLKELASPKKFKEDPVTVWNFYGDRILESLAAQPNAAHYALAALARWHGEWWTINQNVDGLLEQTEHPASSLLDIHGTLKNVRCTTCDYNINVATPHDIPFLLSLSNADSQSRSAVLAELPHCPKCANLLRPGVVWFGERLAAGAPDNVDEWISEERIDLVIAAGTSLEVFPAAEWVDTARTLGASLAIIDTDHRLGDRLDENDWFFQGDIAIILPRIVQLLTP